MSVALRIFHANPIVRSAPGAAVPWELTLTMEHRSYDELSRLWQATTAAAADVRGIPRGGGVHRPGHDAAGRKGHERVLRDGQPRRAAPARPRR